MVWNSDLVGIYPKELKSGSGGDINMILER